MCPHCNGTNDIQQQQIGIEAPRWDFEIIDKEKAEPASTVITVDI